MMRSGIEGGGGNRSNNPGELFSTCVHASKAVVRNSDGFVQHRLSDWGEGAGQLRLTHWQ
jgi:hypothetical protein